MLPPDTLASLRAAVHADPADRAVRLVYADALEETGDSDDAPRADFIRAQIAREAIPDDDSLRPAAEARCRDLFAPSWLRWWREYCDAAGLPRPYVRAGGLGEWLKRAVGVERRKVGDPYELLPVGCNLRSESEHLAVEFTGGFPDSLCLYAPRDDYERLFVAMPVARLGLHFTLGRYAWEEIEPHLGRVSALAFLDLAADTAARVASSPNLGAVRTLELTRQTAAGLAALRSGPLRIQIRHLTLSHVEDPAVPRALADVGFASLDELTLDVVASLPQDTAGLFLGLDIDRLALMYGGAEPIDPWYDEVEALFADVVESHARCYPDRRAWHDFCAGLAEIAERGPLRLKRFRLVVTDDTLAAYRVGSFNDADIRLRPLTDCCAAAMVDGFGDSLELLELPGRLLTSAQRLALEGRWGPRLRVV